MEDLFSDRTSGPVARDQESLSEATKAGLLGIVESKLRSNWFAERFPDGCEECPSPTETSQETFRSVLLATIPDLKVPLSNNRYEPDGVLFDLVEWAARQMSFPEQETFHGYPHPGHWSLHFDRRRAVVEFTSEVNLLLSRGGTVFELAGTGQVQRLGTPEVRAATSALRPATGDSALDVLIEDARERYRSRKASERAVAIEKLWDAFERLKTIEPGKDKKRQVEGLLNRIAEPAMRIVASAEMRSLTDFGNQFKIRHHEVGKIPLPIEAQDYIAARMANLLVFLLQESGRLTPVGGT